MWRKKEKLLHANLTRILVLKNSVDSLSSMYSAIEYGSTNSKGSITKFLKYKDQIKNF